MKIPIIGITSDIEERRHFVNRAYVTAIERSGAIPFILPANAHVHHALDIIDGLLLPGGGDIDAHHFGQQTHEKAADIWPERDEAELTLAKLAYGRDMPILGICRGLQILNVAMGGDLVQHIDGHKQNAPRSTPTHNVRPSGILAELTAANEIAVNSIHHQIAGTVAEGFEVCAMSLDGHTEALWARGKTFVLGVQWHPEELIHMPEHLRLFQALVQAAKNYGTAV